MGGRTQESECDTKVGEGLIEEDGGVEVAGGRGETDPGCGRGEVAEEGEWAGGGHGGGPLGKGFEASVDNVV